MIDCVTGTNINRQRAGETANVQMDIRNSSLQALPEPDMLLPTILMLIGIAVYTERRWGQT